ncbi:MAG: aminotransferase class I/II-fold pyridoxal phosphate-dependent enzyme [Planctomycetota bacterium]|jgi:aspartate aminotransferase
MHPALSSDLRALLEIQEHVDELRKRWARGPARHGADLAYANPYDGPPPAVRAALEKAVAGGRSLDLQYTPYGGATVPRRRVAQDLAAKHDVPFRWQDVVLTPGAMAALNLVLRSLVVPDGPRRVLMPVPCWLDYPLYLRQLGLEPVPLPLGADLRLDLEAIAEALEEDTAALLLSQPGNPTGVAYGEEELRGVAALLHEAEERHGHPITWISDECHRDFVPPRIPCPSPARFHDQVVVVYSFGKRLFIQGQRIGFAAVSPRCRDHETLRELLVQLSRAMGFCTPTALMQGALIDLLEVEDDHGWVHARRRETAATLRGAGYELVEPDGTFFLYPQVPAGEDDLGFTARLAEAGVLVLPSSLFHHTGHVRLSLTDTDEAMGRALPLLCGAIQR